MGQNYQEKGEQGDNMAVKDDEEQDFEGEEVKLEEAEDEVTEARVEDKYPEHFERIVALDLLDKSLFQPAEVERITRKHNSRLKSAMHW